jgi:uncharacterized repeat protein (TIGR02543 family)
MAEHGLGTRPRSPVIPASAPRPRVRFHRFPIPLVAALVLVGLTASSAAAATGALSQLSTNMGKDGCLEQAPGTPADGCLATGRGLNGPNALAVSPDSKSVYVASDTELAVLSRAASGVLSQSGTATGCFNADGAGTCTKARAIGTGPLDLVVSPDKKNVYVANSTGLLVFSRDTSSGALTQLSGGSPAGSAGCVSDDGTDGTATGHCTDMRSYGADWVTISPDGKNVYTGQDGSSIVAEFTRDTTSTSTTTYGALDEPTDKSGCLSDSGQDSSATSFDKCRTGTALSRTSGMAISPDGKFAYIASNDVNAVDIFRRDGAGSLTEVPAGSGHDNCVTDAVNPGVACKLVRGMHGVQRVVISPDGNDQREDLYVASNSESALRDSGWVAAFSRDKAKGTLTQLTGNDGCISESGNDGETSPLACNQGHGLTGTSRLAFSPDAQNLYPGGAVDTSAPGAVDVLNRAPVTGALTQQAGTAGCHTDNGTNGAGGSPTSICTNDRALSAVTAVAVSPDQKSVYATALNSLSVAAFSRTALARFTVTGAPAPAAGGSVAAKSPSATSACSGASCTVDAGADATLTATAASGYRFSGWTGACTNASGACQLTNVTANQTATAHFVQQFTVSGSATPAAGGSVAATSPSVGADCSGASCKVDSGATATLTATAASGYRFSGWTGACTNASGPCQLTNVTADKSATAHFVQRFTVTGVNSPAAGGGIFASSPSPNSDCPDGEKCTVDSGGEGDLTATAADGYRFTGWTGACTGPNPCKVLNVTHNETATANYTQRFTVTGTAGQGGSVAAASPSPASTCAGSACAVDSGGEVNLTASPNAGFAFDHWTGACSGNTGQCKLINVTADKTATATFARIVTVQPGSGAQLVKSPKKPPAEGWAASLSGPALSWSNDALVGVDFSALPAVGGWLTVNTILGTSPTQAETDVRNWLSSTNGASAHEDLTLALYHQSKPIYVAIYRNATVGGQRISLLCNNSHTAGCVEFPFSAQAVEITTPSADTAPSAGASTHVATVTVKCWPHAACAGELTLLPLSKATSARRRRRASRGLGSARFRIRAGHTARVRVRLTGQGRRLVRAHRRLRVIARIRATHVFGRTEVSNHRITLVRRPSHRR